MGEESFASLCQEPRISNIESFKPNHYYGHAFILKQYANYPTQKPLQAVLQHGYDFLSDDFLFGGEFEAPLPVFFPPNPKRAAFYNDISGGKPAIPIGAPFLYAKKWVDQTQPGTDVRKGTLVFPVHSTRLIKAVFDHDAYAEKLDALPDEFKPIAVSIYWRDYLQGSHQAYQKRGFEILSSGHMLDTHFINRAYMNARKYKYSCSNEYGTALFYSVASGCQYFHYESEAIQRIADDPSKLILENISQSQQQQFNRLFSYPAFASLAEQSSFVLAHLGQDCLKTPHELYQLFRWAEWMDWVYCPPLAKKNKGNYPDWFLKLPPRIQRFKKVTKILEGLSLI
jgi:hypothetical protein